MSGPDNLSEVPEGTAAAAEYVLGLLDAEGRVAAEARLAADPAFAAEVAAWWDRLSALIEAAPEQAPPAGLWARIEAAVDEALKAKAAAARAATSAEPVAAPIKPLVATPDRSRRRETAKADRPRRGVGSLVAAALVGAIAASAATVAVMVYRERAAAPAAPAAAALLSASLSPSEGGEPLYVATFDPVRGAVLVTPTRTLPEPADRSRQLWLIPADGVPRPAGLLQAEGEPSVLTLERELRALTVAGASFAISSEPEGGSQTGAPTGPILGAGALAQVG